MLLTIVEVKVVTPPDSEIVEGSETIWQSIQNQYERTNIYGYQKHPTIALRLTMRVTVTYDAGKVVVTVLPCWVVVITTGGIVLVSISVDVIPGRVTVRGVWVI